MGESRKEPDTAQPELASSDMSRIVNYNFKRLSSKGQLFMHDRVVTRGSVRLAHNMVATEEDLAQERAKLDAQLPALQRKFKDLS